LKQAITPQTRAVILVHPNNPTGHFCSPDQARKLNEFCAAHELALVVDEVFFDFSFGKDRPTSFAGNSDVLTFTLSGLSKICGLPQMKLAWMVVSGPQDRKRESLGRLEMIADAYLSLNTPIQLAAMMLLNTRHGFQRQLLERVKTNRAELDRQLMRQKTCSRLKCEGGWNVVLRIPISQSDEDLAVRLLAEKQVHVHPGHFYDFPGNGYFVLSMITPPDSFAKGLQKLLEFFAQG
jgi:aspartate/methionine/tyrosine aminotransferase